MLDGKIKHLEFIQASINRMAGNSFLLKGWSVTLVGGLLALSFKEMNKLYLIISLVILFFFWLLDGFYLSRERLFIKLYDKVRVRKEEEADFSMNTKEFGGLVSWFGCARSKTLSLFYGGLAAVHFLIFVFIKSVHG